MACSKGIDVSVSREILSICSHLARSSEEHVPLLSRIFEGPQSQYMIASLFVYSELIFVVVYFGSHDLPYFHCHLYAY